MKKPGQTLRDVSEADLYGILEPLLREEGFLVKGEVKGIDLIGVRNENEIRIVELKKSFSYKLLYQAVRRLSITEDVYIAIFKPAKAKMSFFTMVRSLSRRLGLGVYLVSLTDSSISVLAKPGQFKGTGISQKKRVMTLKEFHGRKAGFNTGGVTGVKLQTRYLEMAIHIAVTLVHLKKASAKKLKEKGCAEETYSILYKNHYGWFEKTGKGEYRLARGKKREILKQYPQIWAYYSRETHE